MIINRVDVRKMDNKRILGLGFSKKRKDVDTTSKKTFDFLRHAWGLTFPKMT